MGLRSAGRLAVTLPATNYFPKGESALNTGNSHKAVGQQVELYAVFMRTPTSFSMI